MGAVATIYHINGDAYENKSALRLIDEKWSVALSIRVVLSAAVAEGVVVLRSRKKDR
jgi:hypothetical protein